MSALSDKLRCPDCRTPHKLSRLENEITCEICGARFPVCRDKPVLIRHDNEVFPLDAYQSSIGKQPHSSGVSRLRRFVPSPSVNLSSHRCLEKVMALLGKQGAAGILVVGSGGQRGWVDQIFEAAPNIVLTYCDIDTNASVDIYCDAHELPFVDQSFDGVITTAVLEHVLYPETAAAEIY